MDGLPELQIACTGATTVSLDELTEIQGNLKDLTEENYVKLRNSLVEFGFSFPIFMWEDTTGKKWIIDAHQRIRTLRKMRSEGYKIPELPADFIHAKDKIEAKKKLLLLNSRYGTMTREGFDEFISEPGAEIGEEMEDLLVLPEITVYTGSEDKEEQEENGQSNLLKDVICPNCGHNFKV